MAAIGLWLTHSWWAAAVGDSLLCQSNRARSDAILIENFDTEYLLFERAAALRQMGWSHRILVPVRIDERTGRPDPVVETTSRLVADIAHLGTIDIVPMREVEPISLNAARDVLRYVQQEGIQSVMVLSPNYRSRRSALVYAATLGRAGIAVRCEPVTSARFAAWTETWHGVENVIEQWVKLQYYRFYVLPFHAGGG